MKNIYNPGRPFELKSPYGDRANPKKANTREFHAGVDYAAPAGTPVPAATSGVVVYSGRNSGFGNTVVVRNATGDYSLYAHMHDGDRVQVGQQVWPGDTIGKVGSTGSSTGPHLHYSILPASAGKAIDNPDLPHNGGPIGIQVNKANTIDPAKYDPQPYLDESKRVAEIFSGLDEKSSRNGGVPPDSPGTPFFNRFNPAPAAGFVPHPNAPAASDAPANFVDRFGKWDARPFGGFGNIGAPAPQVAPKEGKRSELPNEGAPETLQTRASAWPFLAADASGLGGVLKYGPSDETQSASPSADPNALDFSTEGTPGGDNVPERRLVGRVVNLSAPSGDTPPLVAGGSTGSAANGPTSPPLLGIFSGKPMPDWPLPPPIFQPRDQSPSDDELFQRWMRWVDA